MKLINWKSYYRDEHIYQYNLSNYKDDNIEVRLFNTNDLLMEGDNQINYLNPYLGELPMMYYIWKNNLKSDYIVISQYRRDFTYIDYNELDNDKIQVWVQWYENNGIKLKDRLLFEHDPSGKIKNKVWKFLKKHYNLSDNKLLQLQNMTSYKCMGGFVWAMNWHIYRKTCELIFGILDTLLPNEGWKDLDTILKFRETQKQLYIKKHIEFDDSNWSIYNDNRYLVFIIEDIISVILGLFFKYFINDKYHNSTYIITEVDENNTIFDIADFYRLNIKCNPRKIYIKCLDEKSYNEFYNYFSGDWDFIEILIIKDSDEYDNGAIKLNINQYIDLNIPIDLQNNKYSINNIK